MTRVKMFSKTKCPFCFRAKDWFKKYGISFEEINLDNPSSELKKQFFSECPGARTVPQILIDGKLIGGYEDGLVEKEAEVKKLLGIE